MFDVSALLLDNALLGGIFCDSIITFMVSWFWHWKSLKISQYVTKLRCTKQSVPVFWATLYAYSNNMVIIKSEYYKMNYSEK